MKRNLIQLSKIIIIGLTLSLSIGYLQAAWSNPVCGPTGCNPPKPLNVGGPLSSGQQKIGLLFLDVGNAINGLLIPYGSVGIGTAIPPPDLLKLHVDGGTDAALSGGGYVILGEVAGKNIVIDDDEIMARDDGNASILNIQQDGGQQILNWEGGNVGIGTDDPKNRLHVYGDIGSTENWVWTGGLLSGERVVLEDNGTIRSTLLKNPDRRKVCANRYGYLELCEVPPGSPIIFESTTAQPCGIPELVDVATFYVVGGGGGGSGGARSTYDDGYPGGAGGGSGGSVTKTIGNEGFSADIELISYGSGILQDLTCRVGTGGWGGLGTPDASGGGFTGVAAADPGISSIVVSLNSLYNITASGGNGAYGRWAPAAVTGGSQGSQGGHGGAGTADAKTGIIGGGGGGGGASYPGPWVAGYGGVDGEAGVAGGCGGRGGLNDRSWRGAKGACGGARGGAGASSGWRTDDIMTWTNRTWSTFVGSGYGYGGSGGGGGGSRGHSGGSGSPGAPGVIIITW